jgi:hypothetical protein
VSLENFQRLDKVFRETRAEKKVSLLSDNENNKSKNEENSRQKHQRQDEKVFVASAE